jgi:hypothetical protein
VKLTSLQLEEYLAHYHQAPVQVLDVQALGDKQVPAMGMQGEGMRSLKAFGYGRPLLIHYLHGAGEERVVLHTAPANQFGHENRADRAAGLLLSYDTFNSLPRHVAALDVGLFVEKLPDYPSPAAGTAAAADRMLSLAGGGEFFLLSRYVEGDPYAQDLQRLRDGGELSPRDLQRAEVLARYLAEIHAVKDPVPVAGAPDLSSGQNRAALYRRRIRDTLGSGEGIMGLLDSYPADFQLAGPAWLQEVERSCVAWRWRLKEQSHRLCQVHGDYHPFNILFAGDTEFHLLDRSRGAWGEPADDVSCLAINYLFFSLQRSGKLDAPFLRLWELFWQGYLTATGDRELLSVVAPFLVWRALVLASPIWYNTADVVRSTLFRFVERVLREETFDPAAANQYLLA